MRCPGAPAPPPGVWSAGEKPVGRPGGAPAVPSRHPTPPAAGPGRRSPQPPEATPFRPPRVAGPRVPGRGPARAQTMTGAGSRPAAGPREARTTKVTCPPLPAQLLPAAQLLAASAWPLATLCTVVCGVPEGKDGHWTVPVAVRLEVRGKFVLPWVSERESRPPLDAAPFPSCRLPAPHPLDGL
ncbi:nascent polypeptide-associated complex subunit alpha, muscle-specific form-like [Meriones unguiculatus]|uniref:nascent polypeptide-associated complex subunit alpha, muscle-specific form-like n=1 Tax=Meriones unguiculatus TaxID=10047 RepID=UPI000B4FAB16|nr:nascent polypeptide-associated complex subunit alpha, muscle-specific form-like [Meriones unguiculatus]